MTAGPPWRDCDRCGKPGGQFDPPTRPRGGRNPAPEVRRCRDGDGGDADREADHDGLAHVLAPHGRVGHANRERERRDQGDRKDAGVATSKLAAQNQ